MIDRDPHAVELPATLAIVKTTITHPATTTHGRLRDEQRAACKAITPGLVRLFRWGWKASGDIQNDLARGLDALGRRARRVLPVENPGRKAGFFIVAQGPLKRVQRFFNGMMCSGFFSGLPTS